MPGPLEAGAVLLNPAAEQAHAASSAAAVDQVSSAPAAAEAGCRAADFEFAGFSQRQHGRVSVMASSPAGAATIPYFAQDYGSSRCPVTTAEGTQHRQLRQSPNMLSCRHVARAWHARTVEKATTLHGAI